MEKIKVVLNDAIANKLEIVALDIKYYINVNAGIAQSLNEENEDAFALIDDEDIGELVEIRKRLKRLAYKLKNKIKN